MAISVVICTYRRPDDVKNLLRCLAAQTHNHFDVLVIDGSGEDQSVANVVEHAKRATGAWESLRLLSAPAGLTRQRNLGLRHARGNIVCFFDDDVTFAADFLERVDGVFGRRACRDVGGVTGYDPELYGRDLTPRYKLYRLARLFPRLQPGTLGRCGLPVPLAFQKPVAGFIDIDWLPGFCMIYRRDALSGVEFDERLPAAAGEDLDVSTKVGRSWRLILCGDLLLRHHVSPTARLRPTRAAFDVAYGIAFRLGNRSALTLLWFAIVDLLIDALELLRHPSSRRVSLLWAKPAGLLAGARDARKMMTTTSTSSKASHRGLLS